MIAVRLIVTLQRPATEEELGEYRYYQNMFDEWTPAERPREIRHPKDLMPDDAPTRNVVLYQPSRDAEALYNDVIEVPCRVELGVEGATREVLARAGEIVRRHVKRDHKYWYITIELADRRGEPRGYRTVSPRQPIPMALRGV